MTVTANVRLGLSTLTVQTTEPLDSGGADLALLPQYIPLGSEYKRRHCGFVEMEIVAAPCHPLASIPGKIPTDLVQTHTQIVTAGRWVPTDQRDYNVKALNTWRSDDLETKRRLILAGAGWGGMPRHMVVDDIRNGSLVSLSLNEWDGHDRRTELEIIVVHRSDRPLGPAGQWLYDTLADLMSDGRSL